ncbi:MAG: hypothetical protein KDC87_09250 [Planctomycetes bacterium]|nr:hypothetical protein [Planctomycetota bacterium]
MDHNNSADERRGTVRRRRLLFGARAALIAFSAAAVPAQLPGPGSGGIDPFATTVQAADARIAADGATTITVTPRLGGGVLAGPGLTVVLSTTAGVLAGSVSDQGDGTYTQVLQASSGPAQAQIRASVGGAPMFQFAFVDILPFSRATSTVRVAPTEVTAGAPATVTVTLRDPAGNAVGSGLSVVLNVSLGALSGTVADHGDGSFTQDIATSAPGTAEVTATVEGIELSDEATLTILPQRTGNVVGVRADTSIVLFETIQQAVDAAPTVGLVKILVAPGVYEEVVSIRGQRGLQLEAMPASLTVIRGLRVTRSHDIQVVGFSIEPSGRCCRAVRVRCSSDVVLRDVRVVGAPCPLPARHHVLRCHNVHWCCAARRR